MSFRLKVKVNVPSSLMVNSARDDVPHLLADLIVDALFERKLLADQLHTVGRTAAAFHQEKLPAALKPLAASSGNPYISSSKLMQALFAEDFRTQQGWSNAKVVYANAVFVDLLMSGYDVDIGTIDPELKTAICEKLKGQSEIIVRELLGHPARVQNSPLPKRVMDFLIYSDQRFHMGLMKSDQTRNFTIAQMRDARVALQKQLLVTYLLLPMLSSLAPNNPPQIEVWFLGLLMASLLHALPPLHQDLFNASFAASSNDFKKAVTGKHELEQQMEKIEQQRKRTEQRQASFRTKAKGHQRSRSADTTPIDLHSLRTREQALQLRAMKKAEALANEFELNTNEFDAVMKEVERKVEENESFNNALADAQEFSPADLQLVLEILNDRDSGEMLRELMEEGEADLANVNPQNLDGDNVNLGLAIATSVETTAASTATTSTQTTSHATANSSSATTGIASVISSGKAGPTRQAPIGTREISREANSRNNT